MYSILSKMTPLAIYQSSLLQKETKVCRERLPISENGTVVVDITAPDDISATQKHRNTPNQKTSKQEPFRYHSKKQSKVTRRRLIVNLRQTWLIKQKTLWLTYLHDPDNKTKKYNKCKLIFNNISYIYLLLFYFEYICD